MSFLAQNLDFDLFICEFFLEEKEKCKCEWFGCRKGARVRLNAQTDGVQTCVCLGIDFLWLLFFLEHADIITREVWNLKVFYEANFEGTNWNGDAIPLNTRTILQATEEIIRELSAKIAGHLPPSKNPLKKEITALLSYRRRLLAIGASCRFVETEKKQQ